MKICVLAQRVPYPPNKGEKLRTYHQIKRLVELGHSVSVLSFNETSADEHNARQLSQQLDVDVKLFNLKAAPLRYLWALLNNKPLSVGAFYSSAAQQTIQQLLADESLDVLFLTASSLAYYALNKPAHPTSRCRIMLDYMDVDSDKWLQYAASARGLMRWVYLREARHIRKLEQTANEQFANTFLIAEEEVKLFHREVSDCHPVTVMGNGLAFDEFYPPPSPPGAHPQQFLFTGVMDYKPNVDAVLWFVRECWPIIRQALPDARFTIAGMNPTAEVTALEADASVHVTGFVDDILPCFHTATAFVAPFRLARGVQNKVLQAAACGIPIVTTSMGAEGILFADHESMYIENEASGFAQACIAVHESREQALQKANRALQAIRSDYSWEQQLKPLEEAVVGL